MIQPVAENMIRRERFVRWPLIVAGIFAVFWSIHRALAQSITFDEANTFLDFVATGWAFSWVPWSNNHVLNTILVHAFVSMFGVGDLTVRLPALAGGALYVFAAYRVCTLLSGSLMISGSMFFCLIFSPYVMDYYVAARGYGLAIGFFATALWLSAKVLIQWENLTDRVVTHYAVLASASGALSIAANFSFAYANIFLVAMLVGWASVRVSGQGVWGIARLVLAALSVAAAVLVVIAGPMVLHFPKEELYWGAKSLREMWAHIHTASYPSPRLAWPAALVVVLQSIRSFLAPAIIGTAFAYLVFIIMGKRHADHDLKGKLRLSISLAAVLVLTLLAHWLQSVILRIPLPLGRTSLFVAPLVTVMCGALLAVAPTSRLGSYARLIGVVVLSANAVYFVSALRDKYFHEWEWYGADAKSAFPVLVDACRRTGVREIPVDWKYVSSFKFYQALYGRSEIDGFSDIDTDRIPPGRVLYVVPSNQYQIFVRSSRVNVLFRGPVGGMLILEREAQP